MQVAKTAVAGDAVKGKQRTAVKAQVLDDGVIIIAREGEMGRGELNFEGRILFRKANIHREDGHNIRAQAFVRHLDHDRPAFAVAGPARVAGAVARVWRQVGTGRQGR